MFLVPNFHIILNLFVNSFSSFHVTTGNKKTVARQANGVLSRVRRLALRVFVSLLSKSDVHVCSGKRTISDQQKNMGTKQRCCISMCAFPSLINKKPLKIISTVLFMPFKLNYSNLEKAKLTIKLTTVRGSVGKTWISCLHGSDNKYYIIKSLFKIIWINFTISAVQT